MSRMLRPLIRSAAAVLAASLAMFLAADARAAGLKAVILTQPPNSPGITPVGDPVYIYNFAAYLQPGFGLRFFDTTITIEGLLGVPVPTATSVPVYPSSGSALSGTGWTPESEAVVVNPPVEWPTPWNPGEDPPTVPVADVTFTFIPKSGSGGPVDNTGSDPLFLGVFQVYTMDLPFLPDPYSFTFHYVIHAFSLDEGRMVDTDGYVTLSTDIASVPEPAALLMLGLGATGSLAWAARRRRATA